MQASASSLPLLTLLILTLVGCGDDPPNGPGIIEIGTGALDWEPLTEGQDLEIIAGPQGGYHFVINARIQNLLPGEPSSISALGNPQTRFAIYLEDGSRVDVMAQPYRLGYRRADEIWHELPSGRILQLEDDLIAEENLIPEIYGQDVRLEVEIRDARGKEAISEAWVVAVESEETPDSP